MNQLGVFLEAEREKRNMSRRAFAGKLHTSPDTLTRMVEEGEPPTIMFLRKVSSYTSVGLLTLLQISFPDEIPQPSTNEMRVAQLLSALPEAKREFFIELIENAHLRITQTDNDKGEISVT